MSWSKTPETPIYESYDPPYLYMEIVLSASYFEPVLTIKGDQALLANTRGQIYFRQIHFSEPLPAEPINLQIQILKGNCEIEILQQPRAENDFYAQIRLRSQESDLEFAFLLTWKQTTPDPTPTPIPEGGTIKVKSYIDGIDLLHIQGAKIWFEHLQNELPGKHAGTDFPTYINDQKWNPLWLESPVGSSQNQKSDVYAGMTPPIPGEEEYFYRILTQRSRGTVAIAQYPNPENQHECIIILDDSRYGAADWYEFTMVWTKTSVAPIYEDFKPPYLYFDAVITGVFPKAVLYIQKDIIRVEKDFDITVFLQEIHFSDPLPSEPVNLQIQTLKGNCKTGILEQPRAENNYTAKIGLEPNYIVEKVDTEFAFLITWEKTDPERTPTPWPIIDPIQPTPTPLPLDAKSKVLWILKPTTSSDVTFGWTYENFQKEFEKIGAVNTILIEGEKPIRDDLLNGYQVVIFGCTRTQPPLDEAAQASLIRYVMNGGSILVIGQQNGSAALETATLYAASITRPFGIEFSVFASGSSVFLQQHPLLTEVGDLASMGSELRVQAPAIALAAIRNRINQQLQNVLAISEVGFGRVIAYSNEYLFYNSDLKQSTNLRFAKNVAAWLLKKENQFIPPTPTATPTLMPAVEIQSATDLLNSALKVNQPWLVPKPIKADYTLLGKYEKTQEKWGSFSINGGGNTPDRVGSILVTSLHSANNSPGLYSVELIGRSLQQGILTDVLEIKFRNKVNDEVGFGGQNGRSGSHGGTRTRTSRIHLNPENYTPLLIESLDGAWELIYPQNLVTWTFNPSFQKVEAGLVPTEVEFYLPTFVKERQAFQVVDGVWIFKDGEAWYGELNYFNKTGWIQLIQLIDLNIYEIDGVKVSSPVGDWMLQ